jgi:RHS repeat-associated protein
VTSGSSHALMVGTAAPQYIRDKEERYGNEEDANESPIRPAQWSAGGRRGPGGRVLDESDLSGNFTDEYVYFGNVRMAHRVVSSNSIYYYFQDALASTQSMASTSSTPCFDADYFPFGGEHDYVSSCATTYKFTGQERDAESNSANDYFGARFNSNVIGRFLSPDTFYHDSHVGQPESWNEYAYARDNPMRYNDPSGNTATVSSTCTVDANYHTLCNVTISASIAIYAADGSGITQDQLNAAASTIQSEIQNAWSGSFSQHGVTYKVSTSVSVSVVADQDAGISSGAQNVIAMTNGPASAKGDSLVNVKVLTPVAGFSGVDTGAWNLNTLKDKVPQHEFGHLLGIGDRSSGRVVMHNDQLNDKTIPGHATASDLAWGVREATQSVEAALNNAWPLPAPFPISSTDTVGAPWLSLWWK